LLETEFLQARLLYTWQNYRKSTYSRSISCYSARYGNYFQRYFVTTFQNL